MPKAILKFNLPEEEKEHLDAINGSGWKFVVWDLDQMLRNKLKYDSYEDKNVTPYDVLEEIRNELWQLIEEKNLLLD